MSAMPGTLLRLAKHLHGAAFDVSIVFLDRDAEGWPNNQQHPLIVYHDCFDSAARDGASVMVRNGWTSPWAWGVFPYHHYHSNAWEALLCTRGQAEVQFGGPLGPQVTVSPGDCVIIPPGVVHKQVSARGGFTLLGSYPDHDGCQTPHADVVCAPATAAEDAAIAACSWPCIDPLFGTTGPLLAVLKLTPQQLLSTAVSG